MAPSRGHHASRGFLKQVLVTPLLRWERFGKDPQFAGTRCGYGRRMGQVKSPLVCVECHKRLSYEDAAGWQAYIVGDPEIEDDAEIVIYCPACARREFGVFLEETG